MIKGKYLVKWFALLLVVLEMTNQAESKNKHLDCSAFPKKCSKMYQKILGNLEDNVATDNVQDNMRKISDWIKIFEVTGDTNRVLTNREFTELSALYLIHSLTQIDGKGVCKLSTAKVLEKNDAALNDAIAKLPHGLEPNTRLEKILKHYLNKFMKICDYRPRLEDFNYQDLESMKSVMGEVIGVLASQSVFGYKVTDPKAYVHDEPVAASAFAEKSLKSLGSSQTALIFDRFLSDKLAKDKMRPSKALSDEPTVRGLLKKYLFDVCESYVEKLDSVFTNKWTLAQSVKYNKMITKIAGVHKHLAYFHGCKKVLLSKLAISRAVADYESEISEKLVDENM